MNIRRLNRHLIRWVAPLVLGFALGTPVVASTLSISQTPLFITISLPPNILVVLDDSGSMASAFVPDTLDDATTLTIFDTIPVTAGTSTATTPVTIATGTVNHVSVTVTNNSTTHSVTVTTGSVNHIAVTITGPSGGKYTYSCGSGYTLNPSSPTKGTSSTAAGYSCDQQSYNYSCVSGFTLNPSSPTSGTSSTASGYTCTNPAYTYSCASGYTLVPASPNTGTSSSAPVGTTCNQQTYNYSCPSGYTLSPSSPTSGTSSTASGYSCGQTVATYTCPTGWTQVGSGSTSTCTNYVAKSVQGEQSPMFAAAAYNPLAYDPTITYSPPYDANGNALSTSFTTAYLNGYDTALGSVNLSSAYKLVVDYDPSSSSQTTTTCGGTFTGTSATSSVTCVSLGSSGVAAYYFLFKSSNTGCPTTSPTLDARCYTKVTVSSTSGTGGTDERQNFANWYSFYRTRNLTTVSGADRAFTGLSVNMRVAWLDLGSCTAFASTGCTGWNTSTAYDNRIATFSGTHRQNFFNWLSRLPADVSTPLRTALKTAGTYYTTSGVNSPYAFNPQVTDSPEYVCRPNYTVMMTDGLWNSDSISTFNNQDNTAATLPDGTSFTANTHPFSDSTSNSLADIAFYYWSHSLRSDLGTSSALQYMPFTKTISVVDSTNKTVNVAPYWNAQNDPATWPHMVTFTVGLGMTTTITNPAWGGSTYSGGFNDLVTGTKSWPAVSSDSANNVYDLWHAAIDSRGQFFSADSPQDVTTAFTQIVNRIQGRVGSSSAIAVNSTRLDSDTLIYQAQFNSASWTGEVIAYSINANGSIGNTVWTASTQIPSANSRSIFTWDDTLNSGKGAGISFLWSSLNTTEQAALNKNYSAVTDGQGSSRLSYLRGDQTNEEANSGTFRSRSTVLGDIVNSNPEFAGGQDFGFDKIPGEGASYDAYVASKQSRTPMLYVGANDGMMHALNAATGAEVFDYVPRGVYPNLSALTDPAYTHQYYVDSSGTAIDAYINGAWTTLMPFVTGAGSRELFLLDVSSPGTFSTSNILWDYDGATAGDNDMGYNLGTATVARMNDGDWYVIFGNGYNSPNQHAVLYLYNLRTKTIRKFDTQVGSSTLNNGMSTPNPIDFNGDRVADALYAGDLQGNMWKLDVSSSDNTKWGYTFTASSKPAPLFTATDSSSNVQPITDRPQVGLNSLGQVMVYFGTGSYFLTGDNTVGSNPPVQSFYGILDDQGNTTSDRVVRTNLLQQSVVSEKTVSGSNFRITTNYSLSAGQQGWYIDLNFPTAQGERVVSDSVLESDRIVFVTLIPQGNACQFGGISWIMELGLDNGGQLGISPYDLNGDGKYNANDYVTVTYTDPKTGQPVTATVPVGGRESPVGIIKTPGIIHGANQDTKIASGSIGGTPWSLNESKAGNAHRLSWQQLQ